MKDQSQTEGVLSIERTGRIGGFEAGRLAYGCWRFAGSTVSEATRKIEAALEIGANLLDTAAIYGFGDQGFGAAEAVLGDVYAAQSGLRDRTVLVTKAGIHPPVPYDSRASNLIESCEASLARLRTDAIDVFLIHRPDLLASFEEVAAALTKLRADGKVRAAGVSNFTHTQVRALQSKLDFPLVATQPEFSPLAIAPLEDGTLDVAQEFDMATMAWSPLGGGRLTGAHHPDAGTQEARVLAVLDGIATREGVGVDHVALAWVLAHPANVFALIGTQNVGRIRESAKAFDVSLSRQDWYDVLVAARGAPMP
ncbi:putative oxidoreductase [Shimia isoporae]|uniref:Putative oxidoreductase n=1 Tax=Shimia isoporae TaxID=647720 RepID=A0A4R1NKX2_9RHOB|nr:aldo/keto reductase [Shimia isoporae]TCL08894.1 putative oxidoreductase [Shimia isoporae]